MTMTFKNDLARGERAELEILALVKKKYADAYKVKGFCKEWDIFIPSINKGIEVKYDPMSMKTGNIVVEIEYNNKPSALMTTKAYRWVFHTKDEIIITTPDRLHKVIKDNELYPATFTGPGDPHSKKAYLIKKDLIKKDAISVRSAV